MQRIWAWLPASMSDCSRDAVAFLATWTPVSMCTHTDTRAHPEWLLPLIVKYRLEWSADGLPALMDETRRNQAASLSSVVPLSALSSVVTCDHVNRTE